ncbi:MAG: hypothetical protein ACQEQ5_06330 [Thermodesulfobacteriota bacterium]
MEKRTNLPEAKFKTYLSMIQDKEVIIPGLFQGMVPQGKAYIEAHGLLVISNYMYTKQTAALTLVSMEDSTLKKVVRIYNHDGSPHLGHMGGISATRKHLWIASGEEIYRVPLEKIVDSEKEDALFLDPPMSTEVTCSFATASKGVLYVGEFRKRGKRYAAKSSHAYSVACGARNHALMAGFHLDGKTDDIKETMQTDTTAYPSFFISIPDKVQGAVFTREHIILSRSYGRRNNSLLSVYRTPFHREPEDWFVLENGMDVPVWHLDCRSHVRSIEAPPMTQGIVMVENSLAVLFESASDKYRRTSRFPQDRIHFLDMGKWIQPLVSGDGGSFQKGSWPGMVKGSSTSKAVPRGLMNRPIPFFRVPVLYGNVVCDLPVNAKSVRICLGYFSVI